MEDEEATEPAEESSTEEVVPHFSLHAIAGVCLNETMHIHLQLGNTSLVALLDSGSTHNSSRKWRRSGLGFPCNTAPA